MSSYAIPNRLGPHYKSSEFVIGIMGGSPGELSEERVMEEKRKKGFGMTLT